MPENVSASVPEKKTSARLAFLDNLKAYLAVLVVMHHAGQPYGPTGGQWAFFHVERARILGPFFHTNASFFMGLFFLLSGYFMPAAFERKGSGGFLRDRFLRLGIPILLYGGVFLPLVKHGLYGKSWEASFFPFSWDHLWFLGHLLVYALLYVAWRQLFGKSEVVRRGEKSFPTNRILLLYAVALAVVSLVVRHWWPIDRWGRFIIVAEIAHLPQYFSLFWFGVVAARYRWLETIPNRIGKLWLSIGVSAVAVRYAYTIFHWRFMSKDGVGYDYAWCQWEALLCVGMCVGLLWGFRQYVSTTHPIARFAGKHAFALYILHLPVLVIIQEAMEKTSLGPLTLTLITGTLTLPVCYFLSWLYGEIKGMLLRKRSYLAKVEVREA